MAATPDSKGYWLVGSDGGVFSYGDARFDGSTGSLVLNQPVVGMAATPDGGGYWLVAADGGVFAYGDARFYGSAGSLVLNQPVVGMAATPDGGGYWLVAADGGVFAYGDARFDGSGTAAYPNSTVVGMAADPRANGYWLVDSLGNVTAYGGAPSSGSIAPPFDLNAQIAGIAPSNDGNGYWLVSRDGGVFAFGDAPSKVRPAASRSSTRSSRSFRRMTEMDIGFSRTALSRHQGYRSSDAACPRSTRLASGWSHQPPPLLVAIRRGRPGRSSGAAGEDPRQRARASPCTRRPANPKSTARTNRRRLSHSISSLVTDSSCIRPTTSTSPNSARASTRLMP